MAAKKVAKPVREVIRAMIRRGSAITSGSVATTAKVTRQAAHKELTRMVAAGELFPAGAGRNAHYVARRTDISLQLSRSGLAEDALYRDLLSELPGLAELPVRAERIFHYAFTELVNNAIDHSQAKTVRCTVHLGARAVVTTVEDDGIGAWRNVQQSLGLSSPIEAIGEVSKGKLTTDPERHSGQGIFFTSKAVSLFELASGELRWIVDNRRDDNTIAPASVEGTRVTFEIDYDTTRELRALFDEYTTDLEFDRTRTVVRLFAHGTTFVSRSEAKRLVNGLEKFREVVVDFAGVEAVGQGFADEVFRVWARAHAGTRLQPVNMIEPVRYMVDRAIRQSN